MKKEIIRFLKRPEVIIMLIATILRIVLSNMLGIWYSSSQSQGFDDKLLVSYAILPSHFGSPNYLSLVKTIGYPLFLNFVYLTGLPYSIVVTAFWIIAALLAVQVCRQINQNKWVLMLVYLFVLFTPAAFDSWVGTRLYRNAIISPFVYIVFALMALILMKTVRNDKISAKNILWPSIFLGIFFIFTYYIKEDGIWLLPCLALAILAVIVISVIRYIRSKKEERKKSRFVRLIAAFLIPVVIFAAGTGAYKAVNNHYFGVAEINTRTEGELGEFVSNIYKIESDNRDSVTWAPYDAIEKAFEASETLSQYPELKDQIFHTSWFNYDIIANPITGDFLPWVLRLALVDAGVWQSEEQVSDLFEQVNDELETAFETGVLEKDDTIQISASAGGRTFEEILQLKTLNIEEFKIAVFLDSYEPGGISSDYIDPASCEYATMLTNTNLISASPDTIKTEIGNKITSVVFKLYSVLNPVLLIVAACGAIMAVIRLARRKKNQIGKQDRAVYLCSVITMVVLFGISFMYAFAIAWFAEFIWIGTGMSTTILKFYSIGLVPLLSMISLFGVCLFIKNLQQIIKSKSAKRGDESLV